MLSSAARRRMAKWAAFRNHRERIGRPLTYYGNVVAQSEINALRRRIWELEHPTWGTLLDALRSIETGFEVAARVATGSEVETTAAAKSPNGEWSNRS